MPANHFYRRQLRRTAWVTLVAWLFALAAGVANACALSPEGPAGRWVSSVSHFGVAAQDSAEGSPDGAGHDGDHDHGGAVLPHGHGHDAGKVSCLKFCDDESSTIAKVQLPAVDVGPGLVTMAAAWSPMAAIGGRGFRRAPERPGSQGPPLVIRFLRLAL